MNVATLTDQLAAEGALLATAAQDADWDAPVPACEWDVRAVVTHVGGVHRWATAVVSGASRDDVEAAGAAVGSGPDDAGLVDWFVAGHADLLAAVRAAPADLAAFTFLPADSPRQFWARRQAHETAIHRADVEAAASGAASPFGADFAQDGIAEVLHGFARRRSNAVSRHATIALAATDGPSWRITFGGERIEAETAPADAACDATVAGASSDLYLWLWNRPSAARVSGDADVADLWHESVRVTWA